jgi:hypothetical protein
MSSWQPLSIVDSVMQQLHRRTARLRNLFQESIMKVRQLFALSALALATGTVFAGTPLTRAEVEQAAGQGEIGPQVARAPAVSSTVSRAQVDADTLLAQANRQIPRGSASYYQIYTPGSDTTRARVHAEVLEARAQHELMHGQADQPEGATGSAPYLARGY